MRQGNLPASIMTFRTLHTQCIAVYEVMTPIPLSCPFQILTILFFDFCLIWQMHSFVENKHVGTVNTICSISSKLGSMALDGPKTERQHYLIFCCCLSSSGHRKLSRTEKQTALTHQHETSAYCPQKQKHWSLKCGTVKIISFTQTKEQLS